MGLKIVFYMNDKKNSKYIVSLNENDRIEYNQYLNIININIKNDPNMSSTKIKEIYDYLSSIKNNVIKIEYSIDNNLIMAKNIKNNEVNLSISYKLVYGNSKNYNVLNIMFVDR